MKRSEMLTIIQNQLAMDCGAMKFPIPIYNLCNHILIQIEENGMNPPWSDSDKSCLCSMRGTCPGCSPTLFKAEWEKE